MVENKQKESSEASFGSTVLKVLAFPFAFVVGHWFSSTHIRNSAYDNAKFTGAVQSVSEPHRAKLQEIGAEADRITQNGGSFDIAAKVEPLFDKHMPNVDERLQQLKLGTLKQQWGFTSKYQKQQAIMSGITAFGIVLGAAFSIANSKIFAKNMGENAGQSADRSPSP